MNEGMLEQEIRDYFQVKVRKMEPALWWEGAVSRATQPRHLVPWRATLRRSRLAWAVPLAVLLVAGVAYASSSAVRELFTRRAPWVEDAGLSQAMNLSQTIDRVTVTIERAYADSNAALVGYTVSGPPITATGVGQRYFSRAGSLSVEGGPTLRSSGGEGTVPGSQDVLGDWRPSDRLAVLARFDTSPVEGAPAELEVTLPILVYDRVPIPEAGPATTRTYTFDFSIKFHQGVVVTVGQTAEAAGVAITLEQVRIAPWETRASLTIGPPYDDPKARPWPKTTISSPSGAAAEATSGNGDWQFFYSGFSSEKGEWTIVISELVLPDVNTEWSEVEIDRQKVMVGKGGEPNSLAGPWVFHFNVP